jgi:hypothetical protein
MPPSPQPPARSIFFSLASSARCAFSHGCRRFTNAIGDSIGCGTGRRISAAGLSSRNRDRAFVRSQRRSFLPVLPRCQEILPRPSPEAVPNADPLTERDADANDFGHAVLNLLENSTADG